VAPRPPIFRSSTPVRKARSGSWREGPDGRGRLPSSPARVHGRWHGKRPLPWDMFQQLQSRRRRRLHVVLPELVFSYNHMDLAVDGVLSAGGRQTVTVRTRRDGSALRSGAGVRRRQQRARAPHPAAWQADGRKTEVLVRREGAALGDLEPASSWTPTRETTPGGGQGRSAEQGGPRTDLRPRIHPQPPRLSAFVTVALDSTPLVACGVLRFAPIRMALLYVTLAYLYLSGFLLGVAVSRPRPAAGAGRDGDGWRDDADDLRERGRLHRAPDGH